MYMYIAISHHIGIWDIKLLYTSTMRNSHLKFVFGFKVIQEVI